MGRKKSTSVVNKVLILEVDTFKEKIKVYDFEVVPPIAFEMCGGFIVKYTRKSTAQEKGYGAAQECLDGDHVYHTLKDIGVSKALRKFVLKNI